jgi:hypothetical protein
MQAIRKVGSRLGRDYVLVFPLLFCGFVDQTALRTLALDSGNARSHSIADRAPPEIPDNDPGLGSRGDDGLFRRSERMRALEALVLRAAGTDDPILIQGEAGTGKTLVAKATHDLSRRSGKPFRRVRCTSLPAKRLEAEIFGPGGKLGLAAGGTLLLELPAALQSRVARALNDGRSSSVEWPGRLAANVRVLATTTRPLSALSALSEDLHHLVVRERREEIPSLVEHFRNGFGWVKDRPGGATRGADRTARRARARGGQPRRRCPAAPGLLRMLLPQLSADEYGSRSGAGSRAAAGAPRPRSAEGPLA